MARFMEMYFGWDFEIGEERYQEMKLAPLKFYILIFGGVKLEI